MQENQQEKKQVNEKNLFTIEEIAKWFAMSKRAVYMHYYRGHLKPENLESHKLYFTRNEVENFGKRFIPLSLF